MRNAVKEKKEQIEREIEVLENIKEQIFQKTQCVTLYNLASVIDPLRTQITILRNIMYMLTDIQGVQ